MNNILKQRKTKGCLGCIIVLIIVVVIFIIYPLFSCPHENLLITSKSPDNSYEIIVKYKDAFSFGPQEINVYYKNKQDILEHHLSTTELSNDGATIDESNCEIKWNNNIAEIGFTGDEQGLELYRIDFSDKIEYKMLKSKYD